MISNPVQNKERRSVVHSVGDIVSDIASLAELQFELFMADCSESRRKLVVPVSALLIGLLILAGCFPVALMMMAAVLQEAAGLSVASSLGVAVLSGVIVAAAVVAIAIRGLKSALRSFERSSTELKRNIEWLKHLKGRNERAAATESSRSNVQPRR